MTTLLEAIQAFVTTYLTAANIATLIGLSITFVGAHVAVTAGPRFLKKLLRSSTRG